MNIFIQNINAFYYWNVYICFTKPTIVKISLRNNEWFILLVSE